MIVVKNEQDQRDTTSEKYNEVKVQINAIYIITTEYDIYVLK